jgi:hypothetical protein
MREIIKARRVDQLFTFNKSIFQMLVGVHARIRRAVGVFMSSQNSYVTDLSVSTREAMFAAWLQDQLPILLAEPFELDDCEPEKETRVN